MILDEEDSREEILHISYLSNYYLTKTGWSTVQKITDLEIKCTLKGLC